jgi:hypothetical protein
LLLESHVLLAGCLSCPEIIPWIFWVGISWAGFLGEEIKCEGQGQGRVLTWG